MNNSRHHAIAICYDRYFAVVQGYLSRYLKDRSLAEDLAQDTFIRVIELDRAIDPDHPTMLSYLLTIARNLAFDHLRHANVERRHRNALRYEEITLSPRFFDEVGEAYIEGEVLETLHDVIDTLPQRKRDILLAKMLFRKKNCELMLEFDISNFLLHRTLREIYDELRERLRGMYHDR